MTMLRINRFANPFIALAAMLMILGSTAAHANSAHTWSLQQSDGDVRLIKAGITPIALTEGDRFSGGDWIETGPDGRAVLVRGKDTIVVAPNSRIGLPTQNTGGFATRILQTLGTVMLKVEKQAAQHFEVETPYLAAVVKGTTFTVTVAHNRAFVHVVEGLVEVRNLSNGQIDMIRPGETGQARSPTSPDIEVDIDNRADAVIETTLGSRIDIASTTHGLIRETGTGALSDVTNTRADAGSAGFSSTAIGGLTAAPTISTASVGTVSTTMSVTSGALSGVAPMITQTTGTLSGTVPVVGALLDPLL